MLDYHLHTNVRDGVHSIDEMVEFAIYKGLTEIGLSDHFGIFPDDPDEVFGENVNFFEEDEEIRLRKTSPFSMRGTLYHFFALVDVAKEKYKDKITVKKGVELDLYRSNINYSYDFVMRRRPDYIIGAIHAIDKIGFHDVSTYYKVTDKDYISYLEAMTEFVKAGKMNIVGHINLYKSFVDFEDESVFYPYYDELIKACAETDTCPELNTGTLKPNYDKNLYFLKECAKHKVPIIVTSDAHNKNFIANNFNFAFRILKYAGVEWTATFENCKIKRKAIDYQKAIHPQWFPSERVIW